MCVVVATIPSKLSSFFCPPYAQIIITCTHLCENTTMPWCNSYVRISVCFFIIYSQQKKTNGGNSVCTIEWCKLYPHHIIFYSFKQQSHNDFEFPSMMSVVVCNHSIIHFLPQIFGYKHMINKIHNNYNWYISLLFVRNVSVCFCWIMRYCFLI